MQHPRHTTPVILSQSLTVDLFDSTGRTTPIEAELEYDPRLPYAVTAVFMSQGSRVRWVLGRELLSEGRYAPVGDGDVHVWPYLDTAGRAAVVIELSSPAGEAVVQVGTQDLSGFVERMNDSVPPGTEYRHLDLDATIAAILEAEAA